MKNQGQTLAGRPSGRNVVITTVNMAINVVIVKSGNTSNDNFIITDECNACPELAEGDVGPYIHARVLCNEYPPVGSQQSPLSLFQDVIRQNIEKTDRME